ncbi:MAG: hypothetical protein ACXV7J_02650 [Methylomonas sp.]
MALIALSLGACSISRLPLLEQEQSKLQKDAMGKEGYAPARSFAIDSRHEVWKQDGAEVEVVMTAPAVPGSYPLVIYLPGLGEDANSGRLWRETWAKAGYAVFSMQPLAVGDALKDLRREQASDLDDAADRYQEDNGNSESSEDGNDSWFGEKRRRPSRTARNSDLRYLGHEYFGSANLKNRMEQLFWAFGQLKSRAEARQPVFASIDYSKVVLAGYDLGAQTASAVMGENFGTILPGSDTLRPVAAILLSPSVSLADGNVRGRFQKMNVPLLAITGTEDNDPYSISSPLVRTAIWEHAPAGDKYLLVLKAGTHGELAGAETGGHSGRNRQDGCDGVASEATDSREGRGWLAGSSDSRDMRECFPVEYARNDPGLGYKHVAAILSVSTAFLDAAMKDDASARLWLDEKAKHWLSKAGELKRR